MGEPKIEAYEDPAGGWGSAKSLVEILTREEIPVSGAAMLMKQNKPTGFMCVSCAWAKPAKPNTFEYCENGAKATAWEQTRKRVGPDFFQRHTVTELLGWSDYDLEEKGRITHPLRYDPESDRYLAVSWQDAFAEIGRELRALEPKSVVFYASGRASLETSYMYGLLARMYGNNNLPDSSNMCHEATSTALPQSIGVPVGTTVLEDFETTDLILFFGQNVGSNSPRMLHPLQDARRRGVPIITFNPLRERGLERFTNPQAPLEMVTHSSTRISTQYHQLKAGGDIAAITGMCKALIAADRDAKATGRKRVLDHAFISEHTHGFSEFVGYCDAQDWSVLERRSGLKRADLEAAAAVYARAERTIGIYGMGLTQHRKGTETVQMFVNLMLLRGNIGKPGAGICPVRGHSNVQGQRTVGITEKPELVPLDRLKEQYGFEPPREKGLNTVEACEGILSGDVKAFVSLGGNFVRAIPDTERMEEAWRRQRLTVQISTKLNRSHLVHGEVSYILPCLGRIEIDEQASGPQAVSMEDSTAHFHGSRGVATPIGDQVRSEPWIVAALAKAVLPPNPSIDWNAWVGNYAKVRDAIEATYPDLFKDFNAHLFEPGGMRKPLPARDRQWKTKTGKANFIVPAGLNEDPDMPARGPEVLDLITLRSNDQFNTTVYGYHDRFRGVKGTRQILFMNEADIARFDLADGESVDVATEASDDHVRVVKGLRVVKYDIPEGNCAGYYPELNVLIPLWHHDEQAKTPAAKAIPVRVTKAGRSVGTN
ncbi:FdhF/YdeP family oxidoreductase [Methylobacterium gnaphalii]|uniref:Oxidoreductase alpha (Molybdopterin) subunit n=1 Tax=Methylobacterium gnaphalii TaxID=1010610 RepID=A0A512JEF7_9HYPH|nr:FdhF/YdeP family oxidoreductase [Methylobacterium gnaphalii]GEP08331.1 oxidoreductase alpha (molybdopterin) subunit [Methylobacterium gnaphalii]GJD67894.1 Protein YdeP [Methylobacterium gnaphalii]GLS51038.1 molybdopterin oxidoreductase alpha subunit [Methylobacterium gnaphalii]